MTTDLAAAMRGDAPLLEVDHLSITFTGDGPPVHALDDVSFTLGEHEVLGVVGESGCGKTTLALALLGLLPGDARIDGAIRFRGVDLVGRTERELQPLRGERIAIVFQDAPAVFNPVVSVGAQVAEAIAVHHDVPARELRERAAALLDLVGIPDASRRAQQLPHEYSGGMRQRAMIAMAIANDPDVLVADEPTTALDVTVQAQVLDVLERVQARTRSSMLLVTHDLGVVARLARRVMVMYAGRQAELAPHPSASHRRAAAVAGARPAGVRVPPPLPGRARSGAVRPRAAGVARRRPRARERVSPRRRARRRDAHRAGARAAVTATAVVEVRDLVKEFPVHAGLFRRRVAAVHAVSGVSFAIGPGETLALVGESGCGKSTTARVVLGLIPATAGSVRYRDIDVTGANSKVSRRLRAKMQPVFQDPYASLDPRMTAYAAIEEPMRVHGTSRDHRHARVAELLSLVGLDPATGGRYPHELSGGQRQRVGIARALALGPEVVVLDEPVSALDASVRAGVLNLLDDLQERLSLTYLFIAHDLAVVRHAADTVAVMYLGKIVEQGPARDVYARAAHPYTQALLSAVPVPDPRVERTRTRIVLEGDVPSATDPPSGCRFRTRCWKARDVCAREEPALVDRGHGHPVACHFADELAEVTG